ncbi:MAG: hypothetical protein JXR70_16490 [Spirochaetales bacterium]|nr:hypothetical protein [Spirochaetales bacterium]
MKKWVFGVVLGLLVVMGWGDHGYPDFKNSLPSGYYNQMIYCTGWHQYYDSHPDSDDLINGGKNVIFHDQFNDSLFLEIVAEDNSMLKSEFSQYFRDNKLYFKDELKITIYICIQNSFSEFYNNISVPAEIEDYDYNHIQNFQVINLSGYEVFLNGVPLFDHNDYFYDSDPNGYEGVLLNPYYYFEQPLRLNSDDRYISWQNLDCNLYHYAKQYENNTSYCIFKKEVTLNNGNYFNISVDYYDFPSVIPIIDENQIAEDELILSNFYLKIPDNTKSWTFQIEKDMSHPVVKDFDLQVKNGVLLSTKYSNWFSNNANFQLNLIDTGAGYEYYTDESPWTGVYDQLIYRFIKPNGEYYHIPENLWFPNLPINSSYLVHMYYYKIFQELGVDRIQFYPNNSYHPRTWNAYQNNTWIQSPIPGSDPNINLQEGPNKLILYATDVVSNLSTNEYIIGYDITPPNPVDESKIYFEYLNQPAAPELGSSADSIVNLDGVKLLWQSVQDKAGDYYGVGTENYNIDYGNDHSTLVASREVSNSINKVKNLRTDPEYISYLNLYYYYSRQVASHYLPPSGDYKGGIEFNHLDFDSDYNGYEFLFDSPQVITHFTIRVDSNNQNITIGPENIKIAFNTSLFTATPWQNYIDSEISITQDELNPNEYEISCLLLPKKIQDLRIWIDGIESSILSAQFFSTPNDKRINKENIPFQVQQDFLFNEMEKEFIFIPENGTHSFYITPIDYLENINVNPTEKQIYRPPSTDDFDINSILFNDPRSYEVINNNVHYTGKLTIRNTNAVSFTPDMLKGINIYCYDPDDDAFGVHMVNEDLVVFNPSQVEQTIDFTLRNSNDPENPVNFAHRTLAFFPVVVIKKTDDPSVADMLEIKGTESCQGIVPNYSAYTLYLFENDNGTFQDNPLSYDSPIESDRIIKTNSPLLPSLGNTNSDWLDPEKDKLRFSITTQNGMPILPKTSDEADIRKTDIDGFLYELENNGDIAAAFSNLSD